MPFIIHRLFLISTAFPSFFVPANFFFKIPSFFLSDYMLLSENKNPNTVCLEIGNVDVSIRSSIVLALGKLVIILYYTYYTYATLLRGGTVEYPLSFSRFTHDSLNSLHNYLCHAIEDTGPTQ